MFRTRVTELFGVDHPIMQGGLQWVATADLVSAVAEAGAMGFITALSFDSPEGLRAEIRRCRRLTGKPFGVNITLLPTMRPPDYDGMARVCLEEGIPVVETAGNNPERLMPTLKGGGVKVVHKCTSLRHARTAVDLGADAIVIDGFECAGHPGEDDVTSLVLIPRAVEALEVPVIGSGGFGDGRGLAAALALGAEGVNMGTRFLATREAPVHDRVKQALVERDERSTRLALRSLRNTVRVLHNAVVDRILEIEGRPGPTDFAELAPLVSGQVAREQVWQQGDVDGGVLTAGQVTGLIHDIPTVAELVGRIVAEAEAIIRGRLPGLLA
ncbi:MAG: Enoyl-[acyl-carrier-protein] reductase [Actinobacteria bacterium]|nr:Enoyl-[acyl-carrier-protein] reductase [Actinomycetota bacterium]